MATRPKHQPPPVLQTLWHQADLKVEAAAVRPAAVSVPAVDSRGEVSQAGDVVDFPADADLAVTAVLEAPEVPRQVKEKPSPSRGIKS